MHVCVCVCVCVIVRVIEFSVELLTGQAGEYSTDSSVELLHGAGC